MSKRRVRRLRRTIATALTLVVGSTLIWGGDDVLAPSPEPVAVDGEGEASSDEDASAVSPQGDDAGLHDPWDAVGDAPAPQRASRGRSGDRSRAEADRDEVSGFRWARPGEPESEPAEPPRPDIDGGTGAYDVVEGSSEPVGEGPVRRFLVEVEEGTGVDPEAVTEEIEDILFDERGWTADPRYGLQRVDSEPVDFRVTLASPHTVDQECAPLRTVGRFSCWNGTRAMLNLLRWVEGAEAYGDDLVNYRRYLVSHEVGHALGYGHVPCPGADEPAPTMMQQTMDVGACALNPWPHPDGG